MTAHTRSCARPGVTARGAAAMALVAALATGAAAHNLGFTAMAVPVDSIAVDGSLADWPDAPAYRLDAVLKGWPSYDGQDPPPQDLTAWFRAAWSGRTQRVYLAVAVRDDRLTLGSGPSSTDAVELYLDGSHGQVAPQQYLMFPGGATYAPFGSARNPTLNDGDIDAGGGSGAWTAAGDTVVYEWSLQAFEVFPAQKARLVAGQRLGFDVVAVDKDGSAGNPTWLSWSPEGGKTGDSGLLGDLVLLADADALAGMARVQGRVELPGGDDGWRGLVVRGFDAGGLPWGAAVSGPGGDFDLFGSAGTVSLRVTDAQPPAELELDLAPGATVEARIPVLGHRVNPLPTWPFAVTLGLFGAAALGALLPLRRRLALLGGALVAPVATFRLLARDPEWTAPCALALLSAALASVASVNQYPGQLWGALMGMPGALSTILLLAVPLMMFLALVVLQFGSWLAWATCLWAGARLAGGRGRLFHLVSASGYAGVPALLGLCLASLGVAFHLGGDDSTHSCLTGLATWAPIEGPLASAAKRVELFSLWSWVLGGVGVVHAMDLSPGRAAAATASCWALTLLLAVAVAAAQRAVSAALMAGG